ERVVARISRALDLHDVVQDRVWPERIGRRKARERPSAAIDWLVDISRDSEVSSLRTKVAYGHAEILPDFALDVEVPRLHVSIVEIRVDIIGSQICGAASSRICQRDQ